MNNESLMHWEMWVICSLLYNQRVVCTWEMSKTENEKTQPLLVMMMLHCSPYAALSQSVWDIGRQIKSQCVGLFVLLDGRVEQNRSVEKRKRDSLWFEPLISAIRTCTSHRGRRAFACGEQLYWRGVETNRSDIFIGRERRWTNAHCSRAH